MAEKVVTYRNQRGANAVAAGTTASASGFNSVAIGVGSSANDNATAVGFGANASTAASTAVGLSATASGFSSAVAVGNTATASGDQAVSIGSLSTSSSSNSIAVGLTSTANVNNGIAIGTLASTNAIANSIVLNARGIASPPNSTATALSIGVNTLSHVAGVSLGCTINGISERISLGGGQTRLITKTVQAGGSPQTLTAAQALGGFQEVTAAGAFTLNMDTGTNLDALFPSLSVGLSFQCAVSHQAATTLTIGPAVGITLLGNPAITGVNACNLLFVRTGVATWDCVIVQG